MPIPVLTTPYAPEASVFNDAVALDISTNWLDADFFEIASLPPGFTFDGGNDIGGVAKANMNYTLYIRAGNDDGLSDWKPLVWIVTGQATNRILWGLSFDWQVVNASPNAGVIYIKQATKTGRQSTWNAGVMLVNDTDEDSNAARYDSSWIGSQIVLNGTADTQLRATEPGWEIILDNS